MCNCKNFKLEDFLPVGKITNTGLFSWKSIILTHLFDTCNEDLVVEELIYQDLAELWLAAMSLWPIKVQKAKREKS